MEPALQPGDGASKEDRLASPLHRDGSTARRLYDLLDTLVAMRMDFEAKAEDAAGAFKIEEIRTMLDHAIESTKDVIGEILPPRS